MKHPVVSDSYFFGAPDAAINTAVLRAIFELMVVRYDPDTDTFVSEPGGWGYRIEDQHDDEAAPHYRLEVGMGDYKKSNRHTFHVRYCDFHSILGGNLVGTTIDTAPGEYRITTWLPSVEGVDKDRLANEMADAVDEAYYNAMVRALPDYEILKSELIAKE